MYTNVLNLEESVDGNRIKQGDLSVMRYILTDANNDDLQLDGKPTKVYLTDSEGVKYIYDTTVKEQNGKYLCDVVIDTIIPAGTYTLEIWVDNTYCFPSDNKAKIRVESSVLGNGIEQLRSETLLKEIIDYAKKHSLIDFGTGSSSITITNTNVDDEGNTTVTFSDGTNVIIPKGQKGEDGDDGQDGKSLTPNDLTEEDYKKILDYGVENGYFKQDTTGGTTDTSNTVVSDTPPEDKDKIWINIGGK